MVLKGTKHFFSDVQSSDLLFRKLLREQQQKPDRRIKAFFSGVFATGELSVPRPFRRLHNVRFALGLLGHTCRNGRFGHGLCPLRDGKGKASFYLPLSCCIYPHQYFERVVILDFWQYCDLMELTTEARRGIQAQCCLKRISRCKQRSCAAL